MQRELGFMDATNVEFQRVHRIGDGKPRPILARFLRYRDMERTFSLGYRLKESNFQMFRDFPSEITKRRKAQMKSYKIARSNGIPAAFSASQPDKFYLRGKLWPLGKEFKIHSFTYM